MTPDFFTAIASPSHWIIVLATLFLVAAAVGMHYEALERLNDWLPRWGLRVRPRVLLLIICILLVHIAEIWIFGIGIFLAVQHPELGEVTGAASIKLLDAVYLSTTTFTTIGYGDLTPHGPMRLILGAE